MKTVLKLTAAFVLLLTISTAGAQVRDTTGNTRKYISPASPSLFPADDNDNNSSEQEYIIMSNGIPMLYSNGNSSALKETYLCDNGSKVSIDGIVTRHNGKTVKLGEGDKIYNDGHIKISKKNKTNNDMDEQGY